MSLNPERCEDTREPKDPPRRRKPERDEVQDAQLEIILAEQHALRVSPEAYKGFLAKFGSEIEDALGAFYGAVETWMAEHDVDDWPA